MIKECPKCQIMVETRLVEMLESFPVKGEEIALKAKVRVCANCQTDIYDKELDSETLNKVYELYRQKHKVISPTEIKALRKQYHLTQQNLALLLGWSIATISHYENGSLPDEGHNNLLKLLQDPFNMERLYQDKGRLLDKDSQKKLAQQLMQMLSEKSTEKLLEVVSTSLRHRSPSIYTGYVRFRPEILMEMMLFLASNGGVLKTKLNKLLWYADFGHFQEYTVGISGAAYIHLPYGPVPDQYSLYIDLLCAKGELEYVEEDFGNFLGEKLIAPKTLPSRAISWHS